jgi:hypothetical protein
MYSSFASPSFLPQALRMYLKRYKESRENEVRGEEETRTEWWWRRRGQGKKLERESLKDGN